MKFLKSIKKDEIIEKVSRTAYKYGHKLKKASPTIMIVGAAIGGVTATVLACKATIKAQDILAEHSAAVESIHAAKDKIKTVSSSWMKARATPRRSLSRTSPRPTSRPA